MKPIIPHTPPPTNHLQKSDIGRFMIGVGAVIEHPPTGTILICKRDQADYQVGVWELVYGRLDHHEEFLSGLQREIREELGIIELEIGHLLRVWHFYRGEKSETTEIYGMTFHCLVASQTITLNPEHSEYEWVTPEEALERVTVPGILQDIENFIAYKETQRSHIAFSSVSLIQTHI